MRFAERDSLPYFFSVYTFFSFLLPCFIAFEESLVGPEIALIYS